MSRRTKVVNSSKFLNVITLLLERQEKLLQHINDLEEYVEILEGINDFENGETFIDFIPDEEFVQALEEGLTVEQKDKIEKFKKIKEEKEKEKEEPLHSMDDILKIFEDEDEDKS